MIVFHFIGAFEYNFFLFVDINEKLIFGPVEYFNIKAITPLLEM